MRLRIALVAALSIVLVQTARGQATSCPPGSVNGLGIPTFLGRTQSECPRR